MATEAANRAVMADTDDSSKEAAEAAVKAREQVEHDIATLEPLLNGLGNAADLQGLAEFKRQFEEYKKFDDSTRNLAVETTNLKAQRLSFTTAESPSPNPRQAPTPIPLLSRPTPPPIPKPAPTRPP